MTEFMGYGVAQIVRVAALPHRGERYRHPPQPITERVISRRSKSRAARRVAGYLTPIIRKTDTIPIAWVTHTVALIHRYGSAEGCPPVGRCLLSGDSRILKVRRRYFDVYISGWWRVKVSHRIAPCEPIRLAF